MKKWLGFGIDYFNKKRMVLKPLFTNPTSTFSGGIYSSSSMTVLTKPADTTLFLLTISLDS